MKLQKQIFNGGVSITKLLFILILLSVVFGFLKLEHGPIAIGVCIAPTVGALLIVFLIQLFIYIKTLIKG